MRLATTARFGGVRGATVVRGHGVFMADDGEPKWRSVHPAVLK